jgi:hypothetical protein
MIPIILQPAHPGFIAFGSHGVVSDQRFADWSSAIMTIPNESANQTSAGTNASQINSLISKLSPFSFHQKIQSPTTYLRVRSGENIA